MQHVVCNVSSTCRRLAVPSESFVALVQSGIQATLLWPHLGKRRECAIARRAAWLLCAGV